MPIILLQKLLCAQLYTEMYEGLLEKEKLVGRQAFGEIRMLSLEY
jgi:hypothetical protein